MLFGGGTHLVDEEVPTGVRGVQQTCSLDLVLHSCTEVVLVLLANHTAFSHPVLVTWLSAATLLFLQSLKAEESQAAYHASEPIC